MNDNMRDVQALEPARSGRDTAANVKGAAGDLCARPALDVPAAAPDLSESCCGKCGDCCGSGKVAGQEVTHLSCPGRRNDPDCLDCLLRDEPDRWAVSIQPPSKPCCYRKTVL